jgi:hypothetical protein
LPISRREVMTVSDPERQEGTGADEATTTTDDESE